MPQSEFRRLLARAKGASEFVIAVFVDVRGFSNFSLTVESAEAGLFIKKFYGKVLDEYFPSTLFFKTTGDGLLLVIEYDESTLSNQVQEVVTSSLKLVRDFPTLFDRDEMINFPVPDKVGIGISRGAACKLIADGGILDYSGKVLNQAARLMDIARPSGVVFDNSLRFDLLPDDLKEQFESQVIYVRSIAEKTPIGVYSTRDWTHIHPRARQPIKRARWTSHTWTLTVAQLRSFNGNVKVALPSRVHHPEAVKFIAKGPKIREGQPDEIIAVERTLKFELDCERSDSDYIETASGPLKEWAQANKFSDQTPIRLIVDYEEE